VLHAVPPRGRGSGHPAAGVSHSHVNPASCPLITTANVLVHAQNPCGYAHSVAFAQLCPIGGGYALGHSPVPGCGVGQIGPDVG
jgi:hypothetical protein